MEATCLPNVWFWILAVLLVVTLVADGFDLGVGVLALLEPEESRRAVMMESIEGVWHANQTWLVILGGVLFGAFPRAYGTLLSTLYLPAGLLLFALMARGIGLEYHYASGGSRWCSNLFALGSLATALVQGAMLGAALGGLPASGATVLSWMGPGAALGALALACAVTVLGGGWLAARLPEGVGEGTRVVCLWLALASLVFQFVLGLAVPVWGIFFAAPALAALVYFAWLVLAVRAKGPFFLPAALYLAASLVTWAFATGPYLVPGGLTVAEAAAQPKSLAIMLGVFAVVLPVIAGYTVYQYRVFLRPAPGGSGR